MNTPLTFGPGTAPIELSCSMSVSGGVLLTLGMIGITIATAIEWIATIGRDGIADETLVLAAATCVLLAVTVFVWREQDVYRVTVDGERVTLRRWGRTQHIALHDVACVIWERRYELSSTPLARIVCLHDGKPPLREFWFVPRSNECVDAFEAYLDQRNARLGMNANRAPP